MKGTRPALRYAKAILNIAKESSLESKVNLDMQLIYETISSSDDFQTMLKSPVIKASSKKKVLDALFADKVTSISLGLFNLLEENKRMIMLAPIAQQYTIIYDFLKNMDTAKVTTAVPLTKSLEEKILEKIVELTGNKTSIENKIDPAILGGFILRVGDMQYDASISSNLNEIRKEFDNSQYIPKI
ncbi:ATP synthase F1 subunit delta [Polaribacter uvawellassae]|uniref:ATP synthase F1 subunit delta n=1 Tax=Polaribacter uvawellassae TaxID=3133495 RepID=UPI0032191F23